MKTFIFSDMHLPTQPYLEMPLYHELISRGINVVYVLQDGDIRLTDSIYTNLNLTTINPKRITTLFNKGDLLLMRFAYKGVGGEVAQLVRSAGHKVIQYDPSGIDIRVRNCPAHYLTAKSEALKKQTIKRFPKQYQDIIVTGTIHCDAHATTTVNRDEFMRSYNMDPNKQFVILTPANPGEAWMPGLKKDYKNIVKIVKTKCPNYEIAVKAHPLDYTAHMKAQPGIIHKNQHYGDKHSWEQFAPGIKVIKAEEGYKALKACDAVLNIRSSLAMETALFQKPLININRQNYTTNWAFDDTVMIDIKMDELAFVLNNGNYSIDEEACEKYVKQENYSGDGRAYVRTADLTEKMLG